MLNEHDYTETPDYQETELKPKITLGILEAVTSFYREFKKDVQEIAEDLFGKSLETHKKLTLEYGRRIKAYREEAGGSVCFATTNQFIMGKTRRPSENNPQEGGELEQRIHNPE